MYCRWSLLLLVVITTVVSGWLAPAVHGMRIAIQGSGVSAAAAAERLAKKHDVTVFEAGRGPGGRMSTRRAENYQWDHGAQYFTPKTEAFARAVDEWEERGNANEGMLPHLTSCFSFSSLTCVFDQA